MSRKYKDGDHIDTIMKANHVNLSSNDMRDEGFWTTRMLIVCALILGAVAVKDTLESWNLQWDKTKTQVEQVDE